MTSTTTGNILHRAEVQRLLTGLHRSAKRDLLRIAGKVPSLALWLAKGGSFLNYFAEGGATDLYLAISPEQGRFIYLVGRTVRARRIVEFGTSFGVSTIYLAAAVADNGGGRVIGTELDPEKHRVATGNLVAAGLEDVAEVRLGDALETLKDLEGPIDMVLLDGWKELYLPVLHLMTPKLRRGAVVLADNIFTFRKGLRPFTEYMQSGRNGFQSMTLPIADGFEYAVYEGR